MVVGNSLLHTQHYKVLIKGKVEQYRERSCPPLHCGVVGTEKGAFGSPSTTVINLLILLIHNLPTTFCNFYFSLIFFYLFFLPLVILLFIYFFNDIYQFKHFFLYFLSFFLPLFTLSHTFLFLSNSFKMIK